MTPCKEGRGKELTPSEGGEGGGEWAEMITQCLEARQA